MQVEKSLTRRVKLLRLFERASTNELSNDEGIKRSYLRRVEEALAQSSVWLDSMDPVERGGEGMKLTGLLEAAIVDFKIERSAGGDEMGEYAEGEPDLKRAKYQT